MTKLNLDFSIESATDRKEFVDSIDLSNLSKSELETVSNYILWGKTPDNTHFDNILYKTLWGAAKLTVPYEKLFHNDDSENESELLINPNNTPYIIKRKERFSRKKTRETASPSLLKEYEELWRQIDETDLLISFTEIHMGRREKPPREELLNLFSPFELETFKTKAKTITQLKLSRLKKQLIELRTQQYILKGDFETRQRIASPVIESKFILGEDIPIFPLSLAYPNSQFHLKLFTEGISPYSFTTDELWEISNLLEVGKTNLKRYFDFEDAAHIYSLIRNINGIQEQISRSEFSHTDLDSAEALQALLNTFHFYRETAKLKPAWDRILQLEIEGLQTQEISHLVNAEFGTNYDRNYISYLFRQKIIKKICAAASSHRETYENIFYPELFKRCGKCGRWFLASSKYFNRTHDGFMSSCKECKRRKK